MSFNDIVQIQQLISKEREARDRHWWDEMRQVYHPDAHINVSWYQGKPDGFIQGSIDMAQKSSAYHRLQPITVRVNGDKAVATLSVAIDSRLLLDGVEADLDSHMRLIYRAQRFADGWKLIGMYCVYQGDRLLPAIPGEQLQVDMQRLMAYRSSYRCLSYVLESKGFGVSHDLAGDDRPEQVTTIYDEAFAWLNSNQSNHNGSL